MTTNVDKRTQQVPVGTCDIERHLAAAGCFFAPLV